MAVCVLVLALTSGSDADLHSLGLIPEDLDTVSGVIRVTDVLAHPGCANVDTLVAVDHACEMPPVGNQGRQGSCVAWAHGYNQKTHAEFVEHGWEVENPNHQMSPAFLYNQVNGGQDRGTSGSKVMKLMCEQGCASMTDCPYDQNDPVSWPSESAYSAALIFRGDRPCWIAAGDTVGLRNVRQHIANGYTCVLGIQVWANFDNIRNFNYTYCSSERYGSMRGWHAVTAVGYDDTLATSDGPGAFRMVNSWGTNWGDHGYFWMSYVAVMDAQMSGRQMEFASDRAGYWPLLIGRVRFDHPTRDRVGMTLGVGTPDSMVWYRSFRMWRRAYIDRPFPGHPIVFDLTEGERFLTGGDADTIFVLASDDTADARVGQISWFSAEHREWLTRGVSPDPPVLICDDGIVAHATLHLSVTGVSAKPAPDAPPPGRTTIIRGVLRMPEPAIRHSTFVLLNCVGRKVMDLAPGENDVRHLAPGVYFVRDETTARSAKILIQR